MWLYPLGFLFYYVTLLYEHTSFPSYCLYFPLSVMNIGALLTICTHLSWSQITIRSVYI